LARSRAPDIGNGLVNCVVVYKVDRLTRSLLDFARIMKVFDRRGANFVSVTQQFNSTASLGRLTLNILLSFPQFEREVIAERTRDKTSAARRKVKWVDLRFRPRPGGKEKTPEARNFDCKAQKVLRSRSTDAAKPIDHRPAVEALYEMFSASCLPPRVGRAVQQIEQSGFETSDLIRLEPQTASRCAQRCEESLTS